MPELFASIASQGCFAMVTGKPRVRYTYEDYCQLPDDKRYELIDGEFYEMAPSPITVHQRLLLTLARLLADWVDGHILGEVLVAPFDVILSDNDTFQPDILFVSESRRSIITHRACEGAPDLVVEILSPSTSQRDLGIKRERYALFGVREYWIVDPVALSLEVLALREGEYVSLGAYAGESSLESGVLPGFVLPALSIFQQA